MDQVGVNTDYFDIPVCNIAMFNETLVEGQKCYEFDPRKVVGDRKLSEEELKLGLVLALDLNKDRQTELWGKSQSQKLNNENNIFGTRDLVFKNRKSLPMIYIHSIGKFYRCSMFLVAF